MAVGTTTSNSIILSDTSENSTAHSIVHKKIHYPPNALRPSSISYGSTARIWRHATRFGVVIKAPPSLPQMPEDEVKYRVEAAILQALGAHPRITKFLGFHDPMQPTMGLLFAEASNGDVLRYLYNNGDTIDTALRLKWCRQAAEALSHCHAHGVLHCDLRPENMLLDHNLDLSLCDFGGSQMGEHDGQGCPDSGFFDPRGGWWDITEAMEIFGLGSSMYMFMTGHFPHGPRIFQNYEEIQDFEERWARLVGEGIWPETSNIEGGHIIKKCWIQEIKSAYEVLVDVSTLEHSRIPRFPSPQHPG